MNFERKSISIVSVFLILQLPMYIDFSEAPSIQASMSWDNEQDDSSRSGVISVKIGTADSDIDYNMIVFQSNGEPSPENRIGVFIEPSEIDDECHPMKRKYGLWDHLNAEAKFRGFSEKLELVEGSSEFGDLERFDTIVSVSELPHGMEDYFLSWIEEGGTLISVGSRILEENNFDYSKLFRGHSINREGRIHFVNEDLTKIGDVFDVATMQYGGGIGAGSVESLEILGLGYQSKYGTSNIQFIPIGSGGMIEFPCIKNSKMGNDETVLSWDIANFVESGFLESLINSNKKMNEISKNSIFSTRLSVKGGAVAELDIPVSLNNTYFSNINIYITSDLMNERVSFLQTFADPSNENKTQENIRSAYLDTRVNIRESEIEISATSLDSRGLGFIFTSSEDILIDSEEISAYISESDSHCKDTGRSYSDGIVESLKGEGHSVTILDQFSLASFLSSENTDEILIILGTVLPTSVFGEQNDLISPWIKQGGTIFWIGDLIGGSSLEDTNDDFVYGNEESLRWGGEEKIFNRSIIEVPFPWSIDESNESNLSRSLGIEFESFRTSPSLEIVEEMGGVAIGKVANFDGEARSSVSLIPLGRGNTVLFGGCPSPEEDYSETSNDISMIIRSGLLRIGTNDIYIVSETISSERYVEATLVAELPDRSNGMTDVVYVAGQQILV